MNLTDILPCTAEELFKLQHEHEEGRDALKTRALRLKPFADAFMMCVESCGQLTGNLRQEYSIHMSALALIDIMIEDYSKKNAI